MRTPLRLRAVSALPGLLFLALAACNSQPTTINQIDTDDMKDKVSHAAPVTLPPSIAATKSFRCADNDVVFVDFYSDGLSAGIHLKKDSPPVIVKGPAAGQPMVADGGFSLTGTKTASSVKIAVPGKAEQSCDSE